MSVIQAKQESLEQLVNLFLDCLWVLGLLFGVRGNKNKCEMSVNFEQYQREHP